MKKRTRYITQAGLIAAAYAALTYISMALGLAYGQVQLRLSEALMVLPLFTPAAIPGLAIGCFIGNLGSPYGLADVIIGTAATLLAALEIRLVGRSGLRLARFAAPLISVLVNAVLVGMEISLMVMPKGNMLGGFLYAALTVGAGELIACLGLGIPLMLILEKTKLFKN